MIRDCYEQLYTHKLYKLDEMDQYVERQKLPKPVQKEKHILNSPIPIKLNKEFKKSSKKENIQSRWFHWWILSNI